MHAQGRLHRCGADAGHPRDGQGNGHRDRPRRPDHIVHPAQRESGLIAGVETAAVLADKGYDSDANRAAVRKAGAEPCIPPRKNRAEPIAYDRHLYRERNVIERFFARIKQCRRVATRYDKKAANFLGFVWVASIALMLA